MITEQTIICCYVFRTTEYSNKTIEIVNYFYLRISSNRVNTKQYFPAVVCRYEYPRSAHFI